jgi:hypothetical protein
VRPAGTVSKVAAGDITQDAVLAAMQECDRLGRDAFLEKHGFDRARDYVVVHDGKEYDSKAIYAVAYDALHPDEAPIRLSGSAARKYPRLSGKPHVTRRTSFSGWSFATSGDEMQPGRRTGPLADRSGHARRPTGREKRLRLALRARLRRFSHRQKPH